jgi:hypothetical protein
VGGTAHICDFMNVWVALLTGGDQHQAYANMSKEVRCAALAAYDPVCIVVLCGGSQ